MPWGHQQSRDLDFLLDPGEYGRAHTRGREPQPELQARGIRDVTAGPDPRPPGKVGGRTEVTLFPAYQVAPNACSPTRSREAVLSVYGVAGAVHNSGTHRSPIANWLGGHAFGLRDEMEGEHWRELKRAKDEASAREGGRPPVRRAR